MNIPLEVAALIPLAEVLDDMEVSYYIGGSTASSVYGMSRATADMDLVVEFKAEHVDEFIARVSSPYYVSREAMLDAMERRGSFNLIHHDTGFKLDLFLPKGRAFDWYCLRRRVRKPISSKVTDRLFPLASPEDVVLAKLEWYEAGNRSSERQWTDILYVLRMRRHEMDHAYMQEWSQNLGLDELLGKAMREAEELDG